MSSRIVALDIQQVKRITAAHIEPDGSLVIIGGENAAGKSSVLDAIAYALGGGKLLPQQPLRTGAGHGSVEVKLDDGATIRRTFTAQGGGTLKITLGDGLSPQKAQTWLDARIGSLSFDPTAFLRAETKDQARILRDLCGVDTRALDAERAKVYAERTEIGRDAKRAQAAAQTAPHYPDAVAVPVQEIVSAQATEQRQIREAEQRVRLAKEFARAIQEIESRAKTDTAEIEAEIARLQERAKTIAADTRATLEEYRPVADDLDAAQQELDALPAPVDWSERIHEAEEQNRRVRANGDCAKLASEAARYQADVDKLTARLTEIDAHRVRLLASARFPLPGLSIDASGAPTYSGLPLSQASQAEQIRISMMVGLSLSPDLRIMLIRDGSLLDESNMALLTSLAEEHGAQVWIERVGDADAGAIVIEDGTVRPEMANGR